MLVYISTNAIELIGLAMTHQYCLQTLGGRCSATADPGKYLYNKLKVVATVGTIFPENPIKPIVDSSTDEKLQSCRV